MVGGVLTIYWVVVVLCAKVQESMGSMEFYKLVQFGLLGKVAKKENRGNMKGHKLKQLINCFDFFVFL
jgi:hypothetical protein